MKVHGESAISIRYNHSTPFNDLIDKFMGLFTAEVNPINFGALYFDEPDHTGHLYGPYSDQMKTKLAELDLTLGYLVQQLKNYDLFEKLNLIITSGRVFCFGFIDISRWFEHFRLG
jgi:ectonucleotide pyrophosphatase/phosphodiesterase family protein 5